MRDKGTRPFAFISYSRFDLGVARRLLIGIENYAYPKSVVMEERRPYHDKYVRPIYLDVANLSVGSDVEYRKELEDNVRKAKYLIVLCSDKSVSSLEVKNEIDVFMESHGNDSSLILPIFINDVFKGMHPVVDDIVSVRNCPVYDRSRNVSGIINRRYCLFHILEFLLNVKFETLYNRYEKYRRVGIITVLLVLALIVASLTFGLVNEKRRADAEAEKVKIEKKRTDLANSLAVFERNTFPYSLVVGYVNNFLLPLLTSLDEQYDDYMVLIFMPDNYDEVSDMQRMNEYVEVDSDIETENFEVPGRSRGISVAFMKNITANHIVLDNANTVIAFKAVVDYKMDSKNNPVHVENTKENRDRMVSEYSDEFAKCVYSIESMSKYKHRVKFVRTRREFDEIMAYTISVD